MSEGDRDMESVLKPVALRLKRGAERDWAAALESAARWEGGALLSVMLARHGFK